MDNYGEHMVVGNCVKWIRQGGESIYYYLCLITFGFSACRRRRCLGTLNALR